MPVFDLDARITEEDLSKINRRTRQPIFLYAEVESAPKAISLRDDLRQFLDGVAQDPTLKLCVDIEICVFNHKKCLCLKKCSAADDSEPEEFSEFPPTNSQEVRLAPVLQRGLERINAQKQEYRENGVSYGKPVLLLFTAGNIADELWELQDVVARSLREASVDILPICANTEEASLKAISSKGVVLQMPIGQAYQEIFLEIHNSMERLSKSTAAIYQELAECLVDGSRYFQ